jgi:type III pantothenate kinase
MLLLIDIGNTNTTIGFHDNGIIKDILRLRTITEGRDIDEYSYLLNGFILRHQMERPKGAVICSVVPEVTSILITAVKRSFNIEPINVNHKIKTGLRFRIKNPEMLGADRIANAVAAHRLYKGHLIVIDFGTATTFCVVTAEGEYRGGAIMPGLNISANALAEKTAKLPEVKLTLPSKVLGEDTRSNILTGVILGHAGAVERIIREIVKEIGVDVTVVATGGLADLVVPYVKAIKEVNPFLTLEGLRFIYELNS